jgi:site-specific DNA-methyltransferase (adenine-specific)
MIDLRLGDCLEVMKTIPDKSIDAIITDPPYGTTACKWDSVIDFELMWEQLNRIIKPNGAIVLFGSEPFSSALRMSNIKNYRYDLIWNKIRAAGFLNANRMPLKQHENISLFYKKLPTYNPQKYIDKPYDKTKYNGKDMKENVLGSYVSKSSKNNGERFPKSILKFSQNWSRQQQIHPTQKPVELMEYLIKTYTNENETVLDFTMGSGSTMVACVNTNRNGIGIEMDDEYFKVAEQRIKETEYKLF